MAAPPSGSGNVDKFYFKNSVAKDGKAKSMAKQLRKTTATIAQDIKTEVSLARQYEGALTLLTFCTAYICWLQFSDISCAPCGTVPRMEWGGVWASQYPSNDGTDGRVDLIRVDHKKDKAGNFRIIATKLTGKCILQWIPVLPTQFRYSAFDSSDGGQATDSFRPARCSRSSCRGTES